MCVWGGGGWGGGALPLPNFACQCWTFSWQVMALVLGLNQMVSARECWFTGILATRQIAPTAPWTRQALPRPVQGIIYMLDVSELLSGQLPQCSADKDFETWTVPDAGSPRCILGTWRSVHHPLSVTHISYIYVYIYFYTSLIPLAKK